MQQSVDAFFEFDKRAVVCQVTDGAADAGTWWKFLHNIVPRIGLRLLHAQRNFLFDFVDSQHDNFDFVADTDKFVGVVDAFGPGHFADVHEAFDAVFELHEGAVGHHVYHFTRHA